MRLLFMGTPEFAVPSLRKLYRDFKIVGVATQPDRPAGRGKKLTPPPVKRVALELGLKVFQPAKLRGFEEIIREIKPDCIVVVAYGKILPREILDIPPYGVVNLHASLLPKYRGASPIQRVLMAGERETGNTVMLVNEEMDAGDILSQEVIPIEDEDNFYTLSEKLSLKGADLLSKTLSLWFHGQIKPVPQDHRRATYAPPVVKEEFRICWKAPSQSVRDRIRGLFPNSYTVFRNSRLKILKASIVEGEGKPGEVIDPKSFIVACGEGALKVEELISPKGRKISGEEFVKGYSPSKGELLK